MDRGAWRAAVHGGAESDTPERRGTAQQDLVKQHEIEIPQGGQQAGEPGGRGRRMRRGSEAEPPYLITPYAPWKHQKILSAGQIEGAGATHDSESFTTAELWTEEFIKRKQRQKYPTAGNSPAKSSFSALLLHCTSPVVSWALGCLSHGQKVV